MAEYKVNVPESNAPQGNVDWIEKTAAYYAAAYIHHTDMAMKAAKHKLFDTASYFEGRAAGCCKKAERLGILSEFYENVREIMEERAWNT